MASQVSCTSRASLNFGLNAFRKGWNAEAMAETDDSANNGHGVTVVVQVTDKGTVDLDPVEGEGVQIRQRRISCSEVIQRDLALRAI